MNELLYHNTAAIQSGVENNNKLVIQKSEDYAQPVDYKVYIVSHIQTNGLPSGGR